MPLANHPHSCLWRISHWIYVRHDNIEDVVMWRVFVCCVNRNAGKQEFQSCGDTLNSCINFNKTLQWSYYKWLGAIIKFSPFNLNLLLEYFSWAQNASALWWSIRASVKAEGTISVTISLVASFCSNEARMLHRGSSCFNCVRIDYFDPCFYLPSMGL